jgi:hypothetical protein
LAIRKEDWAAINKAIEDAVASVRPSGWKKALHLLREWSVLGVVATIIIALIGLAASQFYQAIARVEKETKFETQTESALIDLRKDIAELKAQLTNQSLATHAASSLNVFKSTLPQLRSSVVLAQEQKLRPPVQVIDDLASKLAATDPGSPDYWPAAAAVINFRSSLLVGGSQDWSVTFPPCKGVADLDASPNATVQTFNKDGTAGPKVPIERLGVQDCHIQLDGKKASRWDCKRCLVRYSGGPLSLRDVRFEDCLFIFDFRSMPASHDGARLSEELLVSKSQNIDFSG